MKHLPVLACMALCTLAGVHAQNPILKDTFADADSETPLAGHIPEVGEGKWVAPAEAKIIHSGDDAYVSNGEASHGIATVPMTADAAKSGFTIRAKVRSVPLTFNDQLSWIALLVKNESPGSFNSPSTEYIGILFHFRNSGFVGYSVVSSPKEVELAGIPPLEQFKTHAASACQPWNEEKFNDVVFSYDPAKHAFSISVNGYDVFANEPIKFPEQMPTDGLNQFQIAWHGGEEDIASSDRRVGPVTVTPLR